MTVSAATLELLLRAGLAGDALLDVVRSIETDNPAAPEKPVSKGALRMRRLRERHAGVTSDVTCDATCDAKSDATPSPSLFLPPDPQPTLIHTPGDITHVREEPVSVEHPLNAIVAAWLAVITVGAPLRRKRWRSMPPPPGVTDEQWRGFLEHRKAKRHALTDRAYDLLVGKLAKHATDEWPPGRLVDLIVERGWLTFEPSWLPNSPEKRNGQRSHHRPSNDEHGSAFVRMAVAEELAERGRRH